MVQGVSRAAGPPQDEASKRIRLPDDLNGPSRAVQLSEFDISHHMELNFY